MRRILRTRGQLIIPVLALMLGVLACMQESAPVVYVTATPQPIIPTGEPTLPNPFIPTPTPFGPTATPLQPTPNPAYQPTVAPFVYKIRVGDTLSVLAALFGTDIQQILAMNPGLTETSVLNPGQPLNIPGRPMNSTPSVKLIPDSELVNSPAASKFDVETYIRFQPGFIRVYSEFVSKRNMSSTDIIEFFSNSASINPRLLLALIEYRSGWITNPLPDDDAMNYPLGYKNDQYKGLFKQLDWAVNQLNGGYYGWKTRGDTVLSFTDQARLAYAPGLNAGTVALQYFLSLTAPNRNQWEFDVTSGFLTTYMALFGDPFRYAIEPLVPSDLTQPPLVFPFVQGETWYLTSGPHGGWDAVGSGWAAVDFAPPKPSDQILAAQGACFVSPTWVTSMSSGLVVRSGDGAVVVDLDVDGDERSGWSIVYLHIAEQDRIKAGSIVQPGTRLGHASCEGFWLRSFGTHVHVARRYNGEWMVPDCTLCVPGAVEPPYIISGWEVKGYPLQVYQGWLQKDGVVHRAETGTNDPTNQISW